MSKPNKVNKNHYDQGGRLTPDDMARERKNQAAPSRKRSGQAREKVIGQTRAGGPESSRPRSAPEE